ncbi:TPA: hypothetical protein QDZ84_002850 [Shewanella algae]|uniref:hypothetical protein n=1 Tax=Shewanella TaxID=22 RepID=UPI001AAF3C8B|nr:hypothetical protein [Shewanella algae]MBO2580236.1 hypothetical protein [Shewanella algae]HDS1207823.1 hypothetical protein [Shewanella algae]
MQCKHGIILYGKECLTCQRDFKQSGVVNSEGQYQVDIELCIGLHGVCVLSIAGDYVDAVDEDISERGAEGWYAGLPVHAKPIEGIYTLRCEINSGPAGLLYQIKQ